MSFFFSSRVFFEFTLHEGQPNEIKYEFAPTEPFRGLIESDQSYLKVTNLVFRSTKTTHLSFSMNILVQRRICPMVYP